MAWKIQLAFMGGGARFMQHLAAASAFQELERAAIIEINTVAGTSSGSLAAALVAAEIKAEDVVSIISQRRSSYFRKAGISGALRSALGFSRGELLLPLQEIISDVWRRTGVERVQKFGQLKKPLLVIAPDVAAGKSRVYVDAEEDIIAAVTTSWGIPRVGGRTIQRNHEPNLVDGGVAANLLFNELIYRRPKLGDVVVVTFEDDSPSMQQIRDVIVRRHIFEIKSNFEPLDFRTAEDFGLRNKNFVDLKAMVKSWIINNASVFDQRIYQSSYRLDISPEVAALIELYESATIDASTHPLINGAAPEWASGWGHDAFGVFIEFTIKDVTQRLRWIPPGAFLMGASQREDGASGAKLVMPEPRTMLDRSLGRKPTSENPPPHTAFTERSSDREHPQRVVILRPGYWLFDTPVTQGLYEAVMGETPSRFRSADRPVETVSWEEAQRFIAALNGKVPGLSLRLPSEAEWEYACRAGTSTATYAGGLEILGENNAPVLDAIAWYGGNSGVDFELEDGEDSSGWREKQFDHSKAGTRPVKLKKPNAWGLYDMLGNVWEWCEDHWHDSYEGAPSDGSPWLDESACSAAYRVIRGGSWSSYVRFVRSAYRSRREPQARGDFLGFRCARGPGEFS